jgi:hypothetical protein
VKLTLTCRQPLSGPGVTETCGHKHHSRNCCRIALDEPTKPLPKDKNGKPHRHSKECCDHDCWNSEDCGEVVDYTPSPFGLDRQCGETATFEGLGLTDIEDQAVAEGWRVDLATRGEFSREDVCPACNQKLGQRTVVLRQGCTDVEHDIFADPAHARLVA